MKKLSLLVGTLGGAMAGYLFSNKKLREELANAKDAETAAKLLGKHLQRDGKKVAKQVQEFVDSDDVKQNIGKAKKFANQKVSQAKKELKGLVDEGSAKTKRAVKTGKTKAKNAVKRTAKKAAKTAKRTVRKKR
jgi:hypothetical protein